MPGHQNAILLQLKPGSDTVLLAGLMSAALAEGAAPTAKGAEALKKALISVDDAASGSGVAAEQIAAAAKAFAAAKQPVVVIGTGISANEEASQQALNLALLKNAGVLPLMLEANALGAIQMGCQADRDAGYAKIKKTGNGYGEMKSGKKALLVAGTVPDADFKSDFTVVLASHMNAAASKADLVLPLASLYERQGTIVNIYGETKTVVQAQTPAGEAKDGVEIAAELSQVISKTKGFKAKDIAAAVKKVKTGKSGAPSFQPVAAKTVKSMPVSTSALLRAMNEGMLSGSGVAKVMTVQQPELKK